MDTISGFPTPENPQTPFERNIEAINNATKQAPKVMSSDGAIPYIAYELIGQKFKLKLAANGLKPHKGFRLADIKAHYGIKGRSAQEVLENFRTQIWEKYMPNKPWDITLRKPKTPTP